MSSVTRPEPTDRGVSGAITGVTLRYVRAHGGDAAVAEVLAAAGEQRPAAVLEDPSSWSSDVSTVALLGAAGQVLGDPEISRHVGQELLRQYAGGERAQQIRALGSPAELLARLAEAATRAMPSSSMVVVEAGADRALVEVTTRPGAVRRPALCALSKGLLCEVPAVFGLGPGAVAEDQCQARGAKSCRYRLVWGDRMGLPAMRNGASTAVRPAAPTDVDATQAVADLRKELGRVTERLEEMYSTAAELISGEDLPQLLAHISRRAAAAVHAPRYLMEVETSPDEPPQLHYGGFDEEEARALAEELAHPGADGDSRLVVDVTSPRRHYGRLVAVFPPGTRVLEHERKVFSHYGTYAATALDLVSALAETRRSSATARALLDFARALSRVGTTEEVCQTLAEAVPAVVHCDRSFVLLWDQLNERLVLKAISGTGLPAQLAQSGPDGEPLVAISTEDTDTLEPLMASREILVVDQSTADPFLGDLLERAGAAYSVMSPLFWGDEFIGVVGGYYLKGWTFDPRADRDLQERLRALADHAATALQNSRLLEQVGRLAWHDALTGLPNRRLLEDRLRNELERAEEAGEGSTLFYVDLDRFKRVNDGCGHSAGDELLCQVAQRLRTVVRRQDTVARLGGDEFAVVLPGLADMTAIRQLARRMLESLHLPYEVNGTEVLSSASIGVAVFPEHGQTFDELLSHADEAMYRSKDTGRNTFTVFELHPEAREPREVDIENDLRRALAANELFVLYQPYVDLHTGQVVGVEALVRWRHPTRGVLEAGSFVGQAERCGLIVQIDRLVIEEAVRQLRAWENEGLAPLRMSVNVSRRDLEQPDFVDTVMTALRRNDVAPAHLELDVGGQALAEGDTLLHQILEALRQEGVRLAIDDFDAGSSSLEQLAAFPINTVKINHTFLQILGPTDERHLLLSAIVSVAEGLGLECVVGGVETPNQSRILLQRGASIAQGFYFSPPLEPREVHKMVAALSGRDRPVASQTEAAAG